VELHRPRQWGACWLSCHLYEQLELDRFWAAHLPDSREGTSWEHILQTLVCYRLIDPGSEWRLHRQWFEQSAMGDLLGDDYSLVSKNALYRCLVLPHKTALFSHLRQRWQDLFGATFDVLLYDLTSTSFESDPPDDEQDKRRHGYSRDKRSDCVQVVIALIVTPEGFPLAYEILPGNTADNTTLRGFLQKIETQYGKAQRIWVMDRGIPTDEVLAQMRQSSRTFDRSLARRDPAERHGRRRRTQSAAYQAGQDLRLRIPVHQERELHVPPALGRDGPDGWA
jgi:transposase